MKVKMKMKFCTFYVVLNLIVVIFPLTNTETVEPFISNSEVPCTATPVLKNIKAKTENGTSGLDQIFWVLRNASSQSSVQEADDETESTEAVEHTTEFATEINELEKQDVLSDPVSVEQNLMDEQIFLNRNNCDIELQINEWEDKKLKIEYNNLEKNTSGQCHTTIYAKEGLLLALLVTDIHFGARGRNNSSEILRIVSRNNNFNFTLIEYHGNEHYYPVILADSDRVFIILHYNATGSSSSRSGFNLEIFNYYKNPILTIHHQKPHGYSGKDINEIFLTTNAP